MLEISADNGVFVSRSHRLFGFTMETTVIRFSVSVPVLTVHKSVEDVKNSFGGPKHEKAESRFDFNIGIVVVRFTCASRCPHLIEQGRIESIGEASPQHLTGTVAAADSRLADASDSMPFAIAWPSFRISPASSAIRGLCSAAGALHSASFPLNYATCAA